MDPGRGKLLRSLHCCRRHLRKVARAPSSSIRTTCLPPPARAERPAGWCPRERRLGDFSWMRDRRLHGPSPSSVSASEHVLTARAQRTLSAAFTSLMPVGESARGTGSRSSGPSARGLPAGQPRAQHSRPRAPRTRFDRLAGDAEPRVDLRAGRRTDESVGKRAALPARHDLAGQGQTSSAWARRRLSPGRRPRSRARACS